MNFTKDDFKEILSKVKESSEDINQMLIISEEVWNSFSKLEQKFIESLYEVHPINNIDEKYNDKAFIVNKNLRS